MKSILFFRSFLAALLIVITLFACGCGGGTSGTGNPGTTRRFLGFVRNVENRPLAGITLENTLNGDRVETAADGAFLLDTSTDGPTANLEVKGETFSSRLEISGLADDAVDVTLELQVDENAGTVRILSISFTPLPEEPTAEPGGGGANERRVLWDGVLHFPDGSDVRGARITVHPFRLTDTTGADGLFHLETPLADEDYTIGVQLEGSSAVVRVGRLPQGRDLQVELTLEIDLPDQPGGGPGGGGGGSQTPNDPRIEITHIRIS